MLKKHIATITTISALVLTYASAPAFANPATPSKKTNNPTAASAPASAASSSATATEDLLKITKSSAFMFAVTQATLDSCPSIPKNLTTHFSNFLKIYENKSVSNSLGKTGVSTYHAEFVSNYQRMLTEFTKAKPSDVQYLCEQTAQQLPAILIDLYSRTNLPIPSDIQQKTNAIP